MPVTKISDRKAFDEVMQSSGNLLIKFEAEWCRPCKAMIPIVEELAKNNPNIKVVAVDIEGDGIYDLLMQFEVRSVPTFIHLKNGNAVKRAVGTLNRTELSSMVEE